MIPSPDEEEKIKTASSVDTESMRSVKKDMGISYTEIEIREI